ncbi:MAG: hypothetical protein K6E91_13765 [Butyrivibrio sp.]|nr:hypothetical protein [Butyrivibrio sp.]
MVFEICVLGILLFTSVRDIRKKEILAAEIILVGIISAVRTTTMIYTGSFDIISFAASFLPGIAMLLASLITGESLGYGDGLLVLLSGPALGGELVLGTVLLAVFICGLFSGILLVIKRAGRFTRVPFVPFMTLGLAVMEFAKI